MLATILSLLAVLQSQESAGQPPDQSKTVQSPDTEAEVVVRGERSTDGPDADNRLPKVIVGSRIPRRSLQTNPYIASATSLGGLNAGSGMDPFSGDRSLRWKSCRVRGYAIGSRYSCLIGKAQQAVDARQWDVARMIASDLTTKDDLSMDGRYLAHRILYSVGTATDDASARRRALAGMVDTGAMPAAEELVALRTLAAQATAAGDTSDAMKRYRSVAALDEDDYQARIEIGVLLRRSGQFEESRIQFREAIAIMARSGRAIPESLALNAR